MTTAQPAQLDVTTQQSEGNYGTEHGDSSSFNRFCFKCIIHNTGGAYLCDKQLFQAFVYISRYGRTFASASI